MKVAGLRTPTPVACPAPDPPARIAAGRYVTAVVTASGELWTAGPNDAMQCGHANES